MRRLTVALRARPGAIVALSAAVALITLANCASPGLPPGGHVDRSPPALISVTPDTNALNVRHREVVFRFNKVVSERPVAATDLQQLVVVSPSDGRVIVDWRREAIAVRPRSGWRPNTAYTITILPGLSDLFNNGTTKPIRTEFSTGGTIPRGTVRGVAFDWVAQSFVRGAKVEATMGDTSFRYLAVADSLGRFALPSLPPGAWRLRVYRDDNNSRSLDPREAWDSLTVPVGDSARRDFYVFVHDSIPRLANVTAPDSVTLRLVFDKPLHPDVRFESAQFVLLRRADSTRINVRRVMTAAEYDTAVAQRKRGQADSVARADTSAKARLARTVADSVRRAAVTDSISRAQMEALRAARDTVKRDSIPRPARPAPVTTVVLELSRSLASQDAMHIEARRVRALAGSEATARSGFFWRRPPPPRDTTATKAPGARDSASKAPTKRP